MSSVEAPTSSRVDRSIPIAIDLFRNFAIEGVIDIQNIFRDRTIQRYAFHNARQSIPMIPVILRHRPVGNLRPLSQVAFIFIEEIIEAISRQSIVATIRRRIATFAIDPVAVRIIVGK